MEFNIFLSGHNSSSHKIFYVDMYCYGTQKFISLTLGSLGVHLLTKLKQ